MHLANAGALMARGRYQASLKENKKALQRFSSATADQALYQRGLIYASIENPEFDTQIAMSYFQRVIDEFPESPLKTEADIWRRLLKSLMGKGNHIDHLKDKVASQQREIEVSQGAIDRLSASEILLRTEAERLRIKVEKLEYQLEHFKKIDLGIEKKKRVSAPAK